MRVREGANAGSRGRIVSVGGETVCVELGSGQRVTVDARAITNYSLAARRAWRNMPKKAGRPKLDRPPKVMVSLRLDPDVVVMLDEANRAGLLANRSEAINGFLREKLAALLENSSTDNRPGQDGPGTTENDL